MTKDNKVAQNKQKKAKHRLFKPKKKKSAEEDAAIQYLQAQYEKVTYSLIVFIYNVHYNYLV